MYLNNPYERLNALSFFQWPYVCFQNLIVPALDNAAIVHQEHGAEDSTHKPNPEPVDMVNFEAEDSANFVCERGSRERSRRNVKTLTSEIIAQSKVIQFCLQACMVIDLDNFL